MDSKRLGRMVSCVQVKVSGKPARPLSLDFDENCSLITSDQPVSDGSHTLHVPKGFVAVYVGPDHRRFVIPTKVLSYPRFKALMDRAAEEYGYDQEGGLTVPCDEDEFQEVLVACKCKSSKSYKCTSSSYIHTRHHSITTVSV